MAGDYELLLMLKQNPENGVRQLMEQYAGLVYSVISGRAGSVATIQDLEECASDVIYEVFQNRERIDLNRGSLKSFVAVVARKRAINLFNKKTKELGRTFPSGYTSGSENALSFEDDSKLFFLFGFLLFGRHIALIVFWLFMMTMDLLTPCVMIAFGKRFLDKPPKSINYIYGY